MGFETGNDSTGTIPTYLAGGVDPDGKVRAIKLDSNGNMKTSGSGGGGGGDGITQEEVQAAIEAATNLDGIETALEAIAQEGTPISGQSLEIGGSGVSGWLSSIRKAITDRLPSSLGAKTAALSFPVTLATDGLFSNGAKILDSAGSTQATIKTPNTTTSNSDTGLVVDSRNLPIEASGSASSNTDIISSINVFGYQSYSLQLSGTWVGTVAIEISNNNTTWHGLTFQATTSNTISNGSFGAGSNGIYTGSFSAKFLKVKVSTYVSGTINAHLIVSKMPLSPNSLLGISNAISISNALTIAGNTVKTQTRIQGVINTSGDNTIIAAPGIGNRIYITKLKVQLESSTTTTAILKSGATSFDRARCVNDGDGFFDSSDPGFEIPLGTNEAFIINLSGPNNVGIHVTYYIS